MIENDTGENGENGWEELKSSKKSFISAKTKIPRGLLCDFANGEMRQGEVS